MTIKKLLKKFKKSSHKKPKSVRSGGVRTSILAVAAALLLGTVVTQPLAASPDVVSAPNKVTKEYKGEDKSPTTKKNEKGTGAKKVSGENDKNTESVNAEKQIDDSANLVKRNACEYYFVAYRKEEDYGSLTFIKKVRPIRAP